MSPIATAPTAWISKPAAAPPPAPALSPLAPTQPWPQRLIDGLEPGADGVRALAARALELRAGAAPQPRPGRRIAALYFNSSLRTRTSLEAAAHALGVHCVTLQPGKDVWGLEFRDGVVMDGAAAEHVRDAVAVLDQMVDLIAVRAFAGLVDEAEDRSDPILSAFCRHSQRQVLSLESARYHPLQGLADTTTWLSHLGPELRGQPLVLTWAPHPKALPQAVPHQVVLSAALQGMDVRVAHPEGFDLDPEVVGRATALARRHGGDLRLYHDRAPALAGAKVVVGKAWSGTPGYADRAGEAARRATLGAWTVDAATMAQTADAGFMHCLPVRRNVVVTDEVIDGPASWAHETAGLRLWTAIAVLESMLARD